MAQITTLIFTTVDGKHQSESIQINAEYCTVALTTSNSGAITLQRSYNSVDYSHVEDFEIDAPIGNVEFGVSDIVRGQYIRVLSTAPITKGGVLQ